MSEPPDAPAPAGRSEPTRSKLVQWLRLNLALTLTIGGLLWGALAMLVGATWNVAEQNRDLKDLQQQVAGLHTDMVSVDGRFNDLSNRWSDVRHARDAQISALEARIQVLESQIRFFADPARARK